YAGMKSSAELRQGSPALAAEVLHQFAGDGPWAHVDMAGPAFLERSRGDYLDQPGGTGWGVRLIAELATSLSRTTTSQRSSSCSAGPYATSPSRAWRQWR